MLEAAAVISLEAVVKLEGTSSSSGADDFGSIMIRVGVQKPVDGDAHRHISGRLPMHVMESDLACGAPSSAFPKFLDSDKMLRAICPRPPALQPGKTVPSS